MSRYICRKRARFQAISKTASGEQQRVNIPYGTEITERGGFLHLGDCRLCRDKSQLAYDFFAIDDDGRGKERGALIGRIKKKLEKRDAEYQKRWDKIWDDKTLWKFRKEGIPENYWLWGHNFFIAPVADLEYIAELVGA